MDAADALGLGTAFCGNCWSNNLTKLGSTEILCGYIYIYIHILYYIILYYVLLYYIILYCIVLYYIYILYYNIYILYYIILYYIVLYCIVLYIIYYIIYIIYILYIYLWLDEVLDLAGECLLFLAWATVVPPFH